MRETLIDINVPFKCHQTIESIGDATFPNIYNKTQIDSSLALKRDISDSYNKTEVDNLINQIDDFYTKTETDSLLNGKANQSTTYTKTEVDNNLALKANQSTTYTKTEVDTAIANLVDSAPDALNTLNELANALNDDENFSTTVTNNLALNPDALQSTTKAAVTASVEAAAGQTEVMVRNLAEGLRDLYGLLMRLLRKNTLRTKPHAYWLKP